MKRIIAAAVLAASLVTAGAANAYYFNVFVLKQPGLPERKICADINASTPQQAVSLCIKRFGVYIPTWDLMVDNYCRQFRSVWRTVHKDGTVPQWAYRASDKPPYTNGC